MLSGVGDERIHRRHCFYMAGRRECRDSPAGRESLRLGAEGLRPIPMWVCAPFPGKPYFSVEGRKLFAGKSHRRPRGFAPCTRESLILPSRGANLLPGKGAGGGVGLRLISRKALFFRREAQTFCRGKALAAVRVCASYPGKPYFSVERRKLYAGKRRRRPREFAPHTRESLILPLRGANRFPGSRRGVGARNPVRP